MVGYFRVLVVEFAEALKLIVDPVALVGEFAGLVEEFAFALHAVESPFAFVHAAVLVVKYSETVTHLLPFVTLVLTSLLIPLDNVLASFWGTLGGLGGRIDLNGDWT